ncbi:hypothetical protein LguiA_002934 [Lonicera macranthoides]
MKFFVHQLRLKRKGDSLLRSPKKEKCDFEFETEGVYKSNCGTIYSALAVSTILHILLKLELLKYINYFLVIYFFLRKHLFTGSR